MFETSLFLCLKTLLINIIIPLIPGILFLWICFGKKFKGFLLYLLGRFVGIAVVAFSLFNLQFIHFGIGIKEYFIILIALILGFIIKIIYKKLSAKEYFKTLKIKNQSAGILKSYKVLSITQKIFTIIIAIFSLGFIISTFIYTTNFPTYADDSFYNWNNPAINIYQDGGVNIAGEQTEILGRGRLGYPIYIPIYKATISHFAGGFNDIYINIWQRLVFFNLLFFVLIITFDKTKNIFYSVLPIGLIISLPLVFFHASEGYMELASAAYSVLSIRAFMKFLENKDHTYISLGLLLGFILSYIKNDGFIVYLPAILITLFIILLLEKNFKTQIMSFFKTGYNALLSLSYFIFFFLPFFLVKNYYNLGFNQAAGSESGVGISDKIHREIFSVLGDLFTKMDNYNMILIILALGLGIIINKKSKISSGVKLLIYTPLTVFIILMLVFLLTDNYIFLMNQTTVSRVFTIVFILFFSFSGYIFIKNEENN